MRNAVRFGVMLLLTVIGVWVLAGCIITGFGCRAKPDKADCIIVLGCRLYGSEPSPFLRYRLDEGIRLYNDGYGKYIIVSGGKGAGETVAEAEAMKKYLITKGVDGARIIMEDNSVSTFTNLKYSKGKMDEYGLKSAVVVSNKYHLKRASLMAKSLGMKCSYSGVFVSQYKTHEVKGSLRETLALIYFYVFG